MTIGEYVKAEGKNGVLNTLIETKLSLNKDLMSSSIGAISPKY